MPLRFARRRELARTEEVLIAAERIVDQLKGLVAAQSKREGNRFSDSSCTAQPRSTAATFAFLSASS